MNTSRYLVLSDIHLTVPHPWAAFCDQVALGACLSHLAAQPPLTVILAGDTFDFLMLEDYSGFDADKSAARMAAILDAPDNGPVLDGLRALVAPERGHRLVLLAGNHDPEVLQTTVREVFSEAVRMRVEDLGGDALLHVPANGTPAIHGYRINADGQLAFVVHGDRWDISNFIDRAVFRQAAEAGEPIALPAGSRLVYRILRRLKGGGHGWADQVKPEIESIIPLLLYLDWPLAWTVLKEEWGLTANLIVGRLRARSGMANLGAAGPGEVGPREPADMAMFVESLRSALPEGEAERAAVLRTLAGAEHSAPPRPTGTGATLAEHSGFWRWLLRAWLVRARKSSRFFDESAEDEITEAVGESLPPELNLLVAGHTHGRRARSTPGHSPRRYLNSGTWTPVGPLPHGPMQQVLDILEKGVLPVAAPPRSLVEIETSSGLTATLRTWQDGRLV